MVALVTDANDNPVAIHRTWLRHDGSGKAPFPEGEQRKSLGPIQGNAIRLAPAGEALLIGEGIETCLSGTMLADGVPAWSAVSAWNMRTVVLPEEVRTITVLADGDAIGDRTSYDAWLRWKRAGLLSRIARPPRGEDFNDILIRSRA